MLKTIGKDYWASECLNIVAFVRYLHSAAVLVMSYIGDGHGTALYRGGSWK